MGTLARNGLSRGICYVSEFCFTENKEGVFRTQSNTYYEAF